MHLISRDLLFAGILLLTGVHALPTTDLDPTSHSLAKRGVKFDDNCSKKFGTRTGIEWLSKSWDTIAPLSEAGHDGFDSIVKILEFKAGITTVDPKISEADELRLVPLYEVLFGELKKDDTKKTMDKADVAKHVSRIQIMMESLKRLEVVGKNRKPKLSVHCDDDFLRDTDLQNKKHSGPPAKRGKVWKFNTDSKQWEEFTNEGKVCIGENAGVTFIKKPGQTTPETMVICPTYFNIQATLQSKNQPHFWELKKDDLPEKYWNMKDNREDDYHMFAFGRKISQKLFHEMMHTSFFHPTPNYFKDQFLVAGLLEGQKPTKKAYTFLGASELAKENKDNAAKNIDSVVYWSIANYFSKYHWADGYARLPGAESKTEAVEGEGEGKSVAKRDPKGGRSGGGNRGGGRGGGGPVGGPVRTQKTNPPPPPASTPQAPASHPPPVTPTPQLPASTPRPPVSTPAPPVSTPVAPVSTPALPVSSPPAPVSSQLSHVPSSEATPSLSSNNPSIPLSSNVPLSSVIPVSSSSPVSSSLVQQSSSSQLLTSSEPTATQSKESTASITSASQTITSGVTPTTLGTSTKPCTGTLCTSSSAHSSSSTSTGPVVTLSPEPISAEDGRIAEADRLEASVKAWEAAGGGLLALWGLSEVLPTGVTPVETESAVSGSIMPTSAPDNGTFTGAVKPRSTVVPRMEGGKSWWMRYLF